MPSPGQDPDDKAGVDGNGQGNHGTGPGIRASVLRMLQACPGVVTDRYLMRHAIADFVAVANAVSWLRTQGHDIQRAGHVGYVLLDKDGRSGWIPPAVDETSEPAASNAHQPSSAAPQDEDKDE